MGVKTSVQPSEICVPSFGLSRPNNRLLTVGLIGIIQEKNERDLDKFCQYFGK